MKINIREDPKFKLALIALKAAYLDTDTDNATREDLTQDLYSAANDFFATRTTFKRNWRDVAVRYNDGSNIGTLGGMIDDMDRMLCYIKHIDNHYCMTSGELVTQVYSDTLYELGDEEIEIDYTGFAEALTAVTAMFKA